jgi:hypothetical protein
MVFTFSGFNVFNLMHMNHAAVIAHLPWLLLATHILLTSPDRKNRALAFAGVAMVVRFRAFDWQPAVRVADVCGSGVHGRLPLVRRSPVVESGAACGVRCPGALIGAVQLLPTFDFARESTRMAYSQGRSVVVLVVDR